ncbi:mechanosensitive ion channel family protein [Caldalkalibacillus salinus]|uniref:mechanosensitive ion channel family protein n=1 Tax=Caldalkalibacillus salinus TaxID=2803787 RepID=UPI0019244F28|nr:mechanosensitive ion channel family protein [Caldalkalibacillus salinus]
MQIFRQWYIDYIVPFLDLYLWLDFGLAALISTIIFLAFWLFRKIFTRYIFNLILRFTENTKFDLDRSVVVAFEKPLRSLFIVLGLYVSLKYFFGHLPLIDDAREINDSLFTLFRASVIVLIAQGLYRLSSETSTWLERFGQRFGYQFDRIIMPFISKVLRFVIIALAFSMVALEFDYNVSGFIAGLGLGGLAFALAAKDTVGNIFGGIVIITEKPFTIGDWIETPTVEGTVEDLTFRSTKVRTFAQGVVTVPNSTLANEAITNWTKMGRRRITFHLGVTYGTPRDKIKACVDQIRNMLRQHPDIDQETLFVNFDKFNDSSLDIFLYFFTKTTDWGEWLQVKEDCNLRIMEILEKENVSIAFPSRSLYVESTPEQTSLADTEDNSQSEESTDSTGEPGGSRRSD